jgi:hydroxymethylglutaryl-CoA lyase
MAAPPDVEKLVAAAHARFGQDVTIGLHFHNTRALGLANAWTGLQAGVRLFDSSVGGLGGCPFSPGATGNIATEDLVHLLAVSGYETGIDLGTLNEVTRRLEGELEMTLPGQVLRAGPRWEVKGRRQDQR